MSRFLSRLTTAAFAACAVFAAIPALAIAATTFTVDTTADLAPTPTACAGLPADCSLRQAIVLANEAPGDDTIVLPAGRYILSLKGADDAGATGDLDVDDEGAVSIQGAGARATIVDAAGLEDRVLEVLPEGELSLSRLTVTGGFTDEEGGGIYVLEGTLALDRVAVLGNVADRTSSGGGLALENTAAIISESLIAENRNSGDGGGIFSNSTDLTMVNTTIANNVVDTSLEPFNPGWGAFGGALEPRGGHLVMNNVTIAGNQIIDSNGGEPRGMGSATYGEPDTAEITNTIIYGNIATNVERPVQCAEALPSEGHNIDEQPPAGENRCLDAPTDLVANPLLGPLANNGGETDTVALLAGSAAFNAGLVSRCPPVDQRGFPRPQLGGCDIGAFEVQPPPPAVPSLAAVLKPAVLKPTIKRSGKAKVKKAGKGFWVWPGFQLSCPAGSQPCTGTIKARAPKSKPNGKAGASAAKKVLMGKAKFSVAPGKARALKLKLNSRGAKLLRQLGKLRTQFEVVAQVGSGPPVKAVKTAKLKLPKGA